jgi:signal transduction protein with GAF and PtsI domain
LKEATSKIIESYKEDEKLKIKVPAYKNNGMISTELPNDSEDKLNNYIRGVSLEKISKDINPRFSNRGIAVANSTQTKQLKVLQSKLMDVQRQYNQKMVEKNEEIKKYKLDTTELSNSLRHTKYRLEQQEANAEKTTSSLYSSLNSSAYKVQNLKSKIHQMQNDHSDLL